MKAKVLLLILSLGQIVNVFGQEPVMELTFTAKNAGQHVPLNSVLIENISQGGDTTIFAPDTVLIIDYITDIGNSELISGNTFTVSQNYPNPFIGKTVVNVYLPEMEYISLILRDNLGKELAQYSRTLPKGNHAFSIYSDYGNYYLLTISGDHKSETIKMLNAKDIGAKSGTCNITYNGQSNIVFENKDTKILNDFEFNLGDELKYTAYSDSGQKTIVDSPTSSKTYTFQYSTNVEMVEIEGGVFQLNMLDVTIDNFQMSKYKIDHDQFIEFLNEIGCYSDGSYNDPIYGIVEYIDMDDEDCAIEYLTNFI
jgi:hypothetical protein